MKAGIFILDYHGEHDGIPVPVNVVNWFALYAKKVLSNGYFTCSKNQP